VHEREKPGLGGYLRNSAPVVMRSASRVSVPNAGQGLKELCESDAVVYMRGGTRGHEQGQILEPTTNLTATYPGVVQNESTQSVFFPIQGMAIELVRE
jgi:hypothetical protein